MTEKWLPVVGCEGRYEVSDLGRVRSYLKPHGAVCEKPRKILHGRPHETGGYIRVSITRIVGGHSVTRHKRVHRLVLEAFVGPCPPGMEGAHEDGDPANNELSNLKWKFPKDNSKDKVRHGTQPRGSQFSTALFSEEQVEEIRLLAFNGVPHVEIARRFDCDGQVISRIVLRQNYAPERADSNWVYPLAKCSRCGEIGQHPKLCPGDIVEIRTLLAKGLTGKSIADRFGISREMVYAIKSGRRHAAAAC